MRWRALGILPVLFWLSRLLTYSAEGHPEGALWICNISNLLLGAGILLAEPAMISTATICILIGAPYWFVDLLTGGRFYWMSIGTHIVSPCLGVYAIRNTGFMRWPAWLLADAFFVAMSIAAHYFGAPDANVNMSWSVPPVVAHYFPGYWTYWVAQLAVGTVCVLLLDRGLRRVVVLAD